MNRTGVGVDDDTLKMVAMLGGKYERSDPIKRRQPKSLLPEWSKADLDNRRGEYSGKNGNAST